jgi:hypothetical protein
MHGWRDVASAELLVRYISGSTSAFKTYNNATISTRIR